MIIFSNVRISVAMSQFYRDRQVMLATDRHTERTSADAAAAAAAAAATGAASSRDSIQSRSLRHQSSITQTTRDADQSHLASPGSASFNCLQMKVGLVDTRGTREGSDHSNFISPHLIRSYLYPGPS